MRQRLESLVTWPVWAVTVAVFVAFLLLVLPAEAERSLAATGTSETPDTQYLYTADDLERMAEEFGEEGRAHYVRSRATFDVVWPLAYGSFLQATVLLATRRTALRRAPTWLVLLPAMAVLFDLLENTSAAIVMARWPDPTPVLRHTAPLFTFLKWNTLGASFVLAGIGLLLVVAEGLRRRHG